MNQLSILLSYIGYILLGYTIHGIIFGIASNAVAKSKGYNDGFMWGFWLGLIGFLVAGFRADKCTRNSTDNFIENNQTMSPNNVNEIIYQLAKLHEQGILTDEEFSQKKAEILSRV